MMKSRFLAAVALAAVAVTGVAVSDAQAQRRKAAEQAAPEGPAQPKPSKPFNKVLAEIQKRLNAKDFEGAKPLLAEARALPNPTPDDSFFINEFTRVVAGNLKDEATAYQAVQALLDSPFTPDSIKPSYVAYMTDYHINRKEWPQAQALATRLVGMRPDDANDRVRAAAIARQNKDFAASDAVLTEGIARATAAGAKPDERLYKELTASRQRVARDARYLDALRNWVVAYPSSENWNILLFEFQARSKLSGRQQLDLYRLMTLTGALESQAEYIEYADIAVNSAAPGESKFALDQGKASGKLNANDSTVRDLLRRAEAAIAADQKELPAFIKQAQAAKTGDLMAQVGYAHLSYQDYAKAVEALREAQKRGTRQAAEVNLRLGIASLGAGDKPGALAAFKAVQGDSRLVELASLWTIYANQP